MSRVVVASFDDVAVRARPPSSRHLGASGERRTVGSADAPEATRGGAAPPKRRSRAERTGARAREARRSAGRSSPRPPSRPSARQAFHQLRVSRPPWVRFGSLGRVARSTRRRLRARARPLIPSDQASVGVYACLEDSGPGDASKAPSGVMKSIALALRFFLANLMTGCWVGAHLTRLRTVGLFICSTSCHVELGVREVESKILMALLCEVVVASA